MAWRYCPAMDELSNPRQAPETPWLQRATSEDQAAAASSEIEVIQLRQRVRELEAQLDDYEGLLAELPELFERKFQQRLEPLLERYRLLARTQTLLPSSTPPLLKAAMRWRRRTPDVSSQQNAA
jgi:hypothetical protein